MKLLFILILTSCTFISHAQILKKIADKTKQKTEQKISDKISNKVSDAVSAPIDEATIDKKESNKKSDTKSQSNVPTSVKNENSKKSLSTYSKYDFVPGDKIIFYEDFSQDNIGDFPDKWNTNASAELVKIDGEAGKWLQINKKGKLFPESIKNLPENFTLEFDLICNDGFSYYSRPLSFMLLSGGASNKEFEYSFIGYTKRSGVVFDLHPHNAASNGGSVHIDTYEDGKRIITNDVITKQFNSENENNKVRVSIWRQKNRIRIYLNEEKVFDLPRAFAAGKDYNFAMFELDGNMSRDNDKYLVSNIKLAIGAPDTRNKLITEGKFVTTGILFDVNSDKIQPSSFGVLKDIALVLKENATVKIKIVGHTDSDGDDNANMELSKKRAAAVKDALIKEFDISANRIETDGMGEKKPVSNNNSPEEKANNRRVEFIKL
ncbi:MAG: OmpA family protein [Ferruginibacter sp.]